MELSYSVKFNGDEPYQMHEMVYSMKDEDFSPPYRNLPIAEKLIIAQYVLLLQGIGFRISAGDLSLAEGNKKIQELKVSIVGTTYRKIIDAADKRATSYADHEMAKGTL